MNSSLLLTSSFQEKKIITEGTFYFPKSSGDFESTGDINHDYFPSVLDGNPVVLTFDNFTVHEGHTVTTTNRCKGLYLYIKGNLIVDGTLSMTARGACAEGRYVITNYNVDRKNVVFSEDEAIVNLVNPNQLICPTGGLGSTSSVNHGVNGACGSGGFSKFRTGYRRGGSGTSFSGGAGAGNGSDGGASQTNWFDTYGTSNGADFGGAGGCGTAYSAGSSWWAYGGSGAGNPAGAAYSAVYKGQNGTGGLLILIVDGDIVIKGSIQSEGSNGGKGASTYSVMLAGGGAGSGGGAIHVFNKGKIVNPDNISVAGGLGGASSSYPGKAGGNGSINILSPAFEYMDLSGSRIYRHSSNMGSVLNFKDINNVYRSILVLDAKYRSCLAFGLNNVATLPTHNTLGNTLGTQYIDGSSSKITPPIATSDDEFNSIWSNLLDTNSAKENCDIWLQYMDITDDKEVIGVPAISYCRSVEVPELGYCDLPNLNILLRLFRSAAIIDSLDTSVVEYPQFSLGTFSADSTGNYGRVLSSTNFDLTGTLAFSFSTLSSICGGWCVNSKSIPMGVVPILELEV